MKTITRFTLCLFLLIAAGRAETSADERAPNGVLGQNYGEISFGLQDIQHLQPNFYDVTVAGNAALLPHLELGGAFGAGWIGGNVDGNATLVAGNATTYTSWRGVKPFLSTALGYQWFHVPGANNDKWLWGASTGVEIPVIERVLSLTPRVAYSDDFRNTQRSAQRWTFETEGNAWLTRNLALFASVGYSNEIRNRFDSWNWRLGFRSRF